jgi:hypothetical protein
MSARGVGRGRALARHPRCPHQAHCPTRAPADEAGERLGSHATGKCRKCGGFHLELRKGQH